MRGPRTPPPWLPDHAGLRNAAEAYARRYVRVDPIQETDKEFAARAQIVCDMQLCQGLIYLRLTREHAMSPKVINGGQAARSSRSSPL